MERMRDFLNMRGLVAVVFFMNACSGTAATATQSATQARRVVHEGPPIDAIATLSGSSDEGSWIVPGPIALEVGGTPIEAPAKNEPIAVTLIEEQGSVVRIGVRLDEVRFAVWTERARLLAITNREELVHQRPGGGEFVDLSQGSLVQASLKAGARVRRLAHKDHWTQVRYYGSLEITGWLPDAVLVDRAPFRDSIGRIPSGRQVLMVTPGAVIRAEPRWTARELAVMATGYFLETIREIDDAWVEVSYEDGEVLAHGYVSKRDPPGRVHRLRGSDAVIAPPPPPNAIGTSGTCLYSRESGEPIGYLVGDQHVYVEASPHAGWYLLSVNTPWGPIAFAAHGSASGTQPADFVACAPPGTVPPTASQLPASVP
ncbi:MAG: hypothetical protein JWO36_1101 [Myxococcales bacterium]|nr:hypothetical protein [Myxococcales bacterium]